MNLFRNLSDIDKSKYFIAEYKVKSTTTLRDAAWNIAIGQSVGNPNVRNEWESDELFENYSCKIIGDEAKLSAVKNGKVKIAFPVINTDWKTDGISHLLCQLMGGHVDIEIIKSCRLVGLKLPKTVIKNFLGPKYGISGFREYTGQYGKPLFGSIVKPKTGLPPDKLLDMVKQMVDGGVDFIKEDEIMSNPSFCPLEKRVEMIATYLASQSRKVVFCHTVNADPHVIVDRVKSVYNAGGNGVHINVWSGLGVYNSIRKLDLPMFLHFQKSGDRVFTDKKNKYSISWSVVCMLAGLMGVDTIQTGMIGGGYSDDDEVELKKAMKILLKHNVTPVLSCGFHAGLVNKVTGLVGTDYMANVGGAVHGHPMGTIGGARAMRQAIDGNHGIEYKQAIEKWGLAQ